MRMIQQFTVACSLAVALSGAALAENWKLVGGAGLGPISLGRDYTEANKFLTPDEAHGSQQQAYLRYKEGVDLECQNGKITQIFLRQQAFNTHGKSIRVVMDQSLSLGSSVAEMEAALGREYEKSVVGLTVDRTKIQSNAPVDVYYAYPARGLGVLTRAGKVVQLAVWRKR